MEITFGDHGKQWKSHGIVFLNFCGNSIYLSPCLVRHLLFCYEMSRDMRFPTLWYVRPAKPQISLHICAV